MAILITPNTPFEREANKKSIATLKKNSNLVLLFSFDDLFNKKNHRKNSELLQKLLNQTKKSKLFFWPVPYCAADPQTIETFNKNAVKIKKGFYPEGQYLKPLDFWTGVIPKLNLLDQCKKCSFYAKKCNGCFDLETSQALTFLMKLVLKEIRNKDIVADIGCGNSFYSQNLVSLINPKNLFLIEPNPVSLKELKKKHSALPEKPNYLCIEAEKMKLKENFFDCFLFINSFDHLHSPEKVLKSVNKSIKNNGLVFVIVSDKCCAKDIKKSPNNEKTSKKDYSFHNNLSSDEIKDLLILHGFELMNSTKKFPYMLLIFKKP